MEKSKFYVGNTGVSAFVGCTPNCDDLCLVFKGEDLQFIAQYNQQVSQWMVHGFFGLPEGTDKHIFDKKVSFAWTPSDRWCYLSNVFAVLHDFPEPAPEPCVAVNGKEVDHYEERINELEEKCDCLQEQIDELRAPIKNLPQVPSSPLTPVQPYTPYVPYVPHEPVTPYPVWPPQVWYSVKPNWTAPDYTITCTTNFEHSNK